MKKKFFFKLFFSIFFFFESHHEFKMVRIFSVNFSKSKNSIFSASIDFEAYSLKFRFSAYKIACLTFFLVRFRQKKKIWCFLFFRGRNRIAKFSLWKSWRCDSYRGKIEKIKNFSFPLNSIRKKVRYAILWAENLNFKE